MSDRPPVADKRRRTAIAVAGVGTLVSGLLLALLFALGDDETTEVVTGPHSDEIIELLDTPALTGDGTLDVGDAAQVGVDLPSGGWVQKTDAQGRLVQQYRCSSLDPDPPDMPDGWIEMEEPEVELFLGKDRVVTISGDRGLANAPGRALESGEISGHVRICIYDGVKPGIALQRDDPSMVMTTPQATFDNYLGEVTCDSEVLIISRQHEIAGRRLTLRFNDRDERLEYLKLAEVDYILLQPGAEPALALAAAPTIGPAPRVARPAPRVSAGVSKHRVHASAIGDEPAQFYLLSLVDHVVVNQGDDMRIARGDRMTIAFSMERGTVSGSDFQIGGVHGALVVAAIATTTAPATVEEPPVRITCDGPLTMVPLDDPALLPKSDDETRIDLFGQPATLEDSTDGMTASAKVLRYAVGHDRVDLLGSSAQPAVLEDDQMHASGAHLWMARAEGVGGIEGTGTISLREEPEDETPAAVEMHITWSDGVHFEFTTGSGDDVLKSVLCRGDVALTSADGNVTCGLLDVHFAPDGSGSSAPSLAIATENVKAVSDQQILWADRAQVTFKQGAGDDDPLGGDLQADRMSAEGDVQVLLADGGRAFCDTLDGDAGQEEAELRGNILIAYERLLLDRGDEAVLILHRSEGRGDWTGPGQARFLAEPIEVGSEGRIERPTVPAKEPDEPVAQQVTMRATWAEAMALDSTFNDEAGALDLHGEVVVRSQRTPLERSEMSGGSMRLEFVHDDVNDPDQRRVGRVIAREHARMEHRRWEDELLESAPVVSYIGGEHLEFNDVSGEALAVGNGELVLRDPRPADAAEHQSALAGRGTTRFTWSGELDTTRLSPSLVRIDMNGDVEMLHKALDGSVGMLSADRMEILAEDPDAAATGDGTSSLGISAMDLRQIEAIGGVYVATETRRVDCDHIDYDLRTGIARLKAATGQTLAIVTEGSPYPVRATSVVWNMDPAIDTITIHGLRGTGGR